MLLLGTTNAKDVSGARRGCAIFNPSSSCGTHCDVLYTHLFPPTPLFSAPSSGMSLSAWKSQQQHDHDSRGPAVVGSNGLR
jgi:hypothetical protein